MSSRRRPRRSAAASSSSSSSTAAPSKKKKPKKSSKKTSSKSSLLAAATAAATSGASSSSSAAAAAAAVGHPEVDLVQLRRDIRALLDEQAFRSAARLCEFLVTARTRKADESAGDYMMFGDALFGMGDYARALRQYAWVVEMGAAAVAVMEPGMVTRAHVRSAKCWERLGNSVKALRELERTNPRERKLGTLLELARLSEENQKKSAATGYYEQAVKINPMAIEATEALARLGVDSRALTGLYRSSPNNEWLVEYVNSAGHAASMRYRKSIASLMQLLEWFPDNLALLAKRAYSEMQVSSLERTRVTLERMHERDDRACELMSVLAWIYRTTGQVRKLCSLSESLMLSCTARPEPWVAAALFADMTDHDLAQRYLSKALFIDPRHVSAHIVAGYIHASQKQYRKALESYRAAYTIDRHDLSAFQGLVESHINLKDFRLALASAKEVLTMMPRNPKALVLVGHVLGRSVEGRENARKLFYKALSIDPQCFDAVVGLVNIFVLKKDYDSAVEMLNQHRGTQPKELIYTKIAKIYMHKGEFDQARSHLHTALGINPSYGRALQTLEALNAAEESAGDAGAGLDVGSPSSDDLLF